MPTKTETTPKTETKVKTKANNRVELFIPRGAEQDEPNLLISVNGENYLLPKGKTSLVPEHIANEYYRSQRALERLYEKKHAMQKAAE